MSRNRRVLQSLLFALLVLGWTASAAQAGSFSVTYQVADLGGGPFASCSGTPLACTTTPGGTLTVSGTATRAYGGIVDYGQLMPTALNIMITAASSQFSWSLALTPAAGAGIFGFANAAGTSVPLFQWTAAPVSPLFNNPVDYTAGLLMTFTNFFSGSADFGPGILSRANATTFDYRGFSVQGNEIQRVFDVGVQVPEPTTALLLGGGLAALAAFGHSRGRQRRS